MVFDRYIAICLALTIVALRRGDFRSYIVTPGYSARTASWIASIRFITIRGETISQASAIAALGIGGMAFSVSLPGRRSPTGTLAALENLCSLACLAVAESRCDGVAIC